MTATIIPFPQANPASVLERAFADHAAVEFGHWTEPEELTDELAQPLMLAIEWDRWASNLGLDELDSPDFREIAAQVIRRNTHR